MYGHRHLLEAYYSAYAESHKQGCWSHGEFGGFPAIWDSGRLLAEYTCGVTDNVLRSLGKMVSQILLPRKYGRIWPRSLQYYGLEHHLPNVVLLLSQTKQAGDTLRGNLGSRPARFTQIV